MPTNIALYNGSTDPADHLNHFVGAANSREWPMPVWCRMFQQTLDGSARGWFEILPPNSIDEWWRLREAFTTRYSTRKACYKEPHEITKIVRKANETLTAFKERWTVEDRDVHHGQFRKAEEAYALAELPLGESRDIHRRLSFPVWSRDVHQRLTFPAARRDHRDDRNSPGKDFRKGDYKNSYKVRDNFNLGRHRDYRAPYPQREQTNRPVPVLSLDSLTKCPKEILATETQLQLPPPKPVANPLRTGDPDKYCDYHQDKGHHTNDCIQLRKQLEIALEIMKVLKSLDEGRPEAEKRPKKKRADVTEQIIVNPSFPDQTVTIGRKGLSKVVRTTNNALKGNMEVFAWEPADMTGVPRKVIEHALNVNPSLDPVCQKRRTFSPEKSRAVTEEVTEWIKARIVRPVKTCKVRRLWVFHGTEVFRDAYRVSPNPNGKGGRRKNSLQHRAGNVCYTEDAISCLKTAGPPIKDM
ncbi:reverse transcriptase domain-containing protein [Tanacetum coccineum]